jgi:hypothetical protein
MDSNLRLVHYKAMFNPWDTWNSFEVRQEES